MKMKENTCINCQETRNLLRSYFTVDQYMDGSIKTSIYDVTRKVQPSPYLRSKMETALVVSPKLSGHRRLNPLVILLPCSSTSPAKGASHTHNKKTRRLGVAMTLDLSFMELVPLSQVHLLNHLMVMECAIHVIISLVIISPWKTVRTC